MYSQFFLINGAKQQVDEHNSDNIRAARGRIRNYVMGNIGSKPKVASLVSRIEARLRASAAESSAVAGDHTNQVTKTVFTRRNSKEVSAKTPVVQASAIQFSERDSAEAMFSTHDTWGIVDTGATKTVIGSEHVVSLLQGLSPDIRNRVRRCRCDVMFRFGNQGLLKSDHALVVPIGSLGLKIAVVPGTTPFLLSNTLMRALGATIDTSTNCLVLPNQGAHVQMQLSQKGLYLLDINQLIEAGCQVKSASKVAETYAQDSLPEPAKTQLPADERERVSGQMEGNQVSKGQHSNSQLSVSCQDTHHRQDTHHHSRQIKSNMSDIMHDNFADQPSQFVQSKSESIMNAPKDHQPQNVPIVPSKKPCSSNHERLGRAIAESAGIQSDRRGGKHRPPDTGYAQDGEDVVRQSALGTSIHRGMALKPRVDQMVFPALPEQQQIGSSKDDSFHQNDDRRDGVSWRCASAGAHISNDACYSKDNDRSSQSQGNASYIDQHRDAGRSYGHTLDRDRGSSQSPCAHAQSGERLAPDHRASHSDSNRDLSSDADRGGMERSLEQLKVPMNECHFALTAGEMDTFSETCPNKERIHFWNLVSKIEKEMHEQIKQTRPLGKPVDLEVFCSENSNLTNQVNQMGGTAIRFGLNQGDLHTTEGRTKLFQAIGRHQPRNIWMSPICKPWSGWSQFNSSRSLECWDKIHAERHEKLIQVALCLVLCRFQIRLLRHAHWEQPRGSMMMTLDLCTGNLPIHVACVP